MDYILNVHFGPFDSIWLKGYGIWPDFFFSQNQGSFFIKDQTHLVSQQTDGIYYFFLSTFVQLRLQQKQNTCSLF